MNLKCLSECASLSQELKTSVVNLKSPKDPWPVETKQLVKNEVAELSEDELLKLEFIPYGSNKFITIETFLNEKARQVWEYANDPELVDKNHRANLKCRAIVGVGMQGVVIRSVGATKRKP